MDETKQPPYDGGNRLIDGLPPADRDRIVAHLTTMVGEEAGAGISRGEQISAVYFPIDAVFSILVELRGGDCYEADSVGREGIIGAETLLGAGIASRSVICQVGGRFAQMPVDAFERCIADAPSFAAAVHRALLMQWYRAQQTIACNFAHTPSERCARWTLLTHDAVGRAEFPLREEYLAMMLGVQTNVVTEPMVALQAIGAIRFAGGVVTIVSERRLREAACECYTAPVEFAQRLETRSAGSARDSVARPG
jgi:CRP-like cAMP-binding protein